MESRSSSSETEAEANDISAGETVDLEQLRAVFELVDLRPAAFRILGKFSLKFR